MYISAIADINRRLFLKRSLALSCTAAAAPLALNLASIGEAAAAEAKDYKALVCVFLFGGNDYANTLIPSDLRNYDRYNAIRGGAAGRKRGGIALGHDELANTALTPRRAQVLTDNISYALAPEMTGLAGLFNSGQAAVLLNVGPLLTPLTLQQYKSSNRLKYPLPPKLFSHNDQQSIWQAEDSEGATVGWGGRLGDLALSANQTSSLTCISASGNAVFVSGNTAVQYQISPSGAIPIWPAKGSLFGSGLASDVLKTLVTQSSGHLLENEFSKVTQRSIALESIVNSALSPVSLATKFDISGNNSLAGQLQVIARLIAARKTLGSRRQVFFVSLGGFDNHSGLMANHPGLMAHLNEALCQFHSATVELGVSENVTTFTASDFGRTLTSNGDGSDHGWGGHHFILGGAVKGGQYYGTAPKVSVDSDDQVGQGRLLPTTAAVQMSATLARWFGVSTDDLGDILPHLNRFDTPDLGFMM